MLWVLYISFLFIGSNKAIQIVSLNGDRSGSVCPQLLVHFTYTQQNNSQINVQVTDSANRTFPISKCSTITKINGICSISNLYYSNGERVKLSILETSSNGTVLQTDSITTTINFTMIFGPLKNISRVLQSQNQLYISYVTLAEVCYKHEKIQKIQLEQCSYDQKWICKHFVNPSWLYYGCQLANISVYQTCFIKVPTLEDNVKYRFRLRYSISLIDDFSAWSDFLYHNTKSKAPKIPPALFCSQDEEKNRVKLYWFKPRNDDLLENYTHFLLNIMDSDHTVIKKEIPVTSEIRYSINEENVFGKKYKVEVCTSQGCSQSIEHHCFFENLNSPSANVLIAIISIVLVIVVTLIGFVIRVFYKKRQNHEDPSQDSDKSYDYTQVLPRQQIPLVPYCETRFNKEGTPL